MLQPVQRMVVGESFWGRGGHVRGCTLWGRPAGVDRITGRPFAAGGNQQLTCGHAPRASFNASGAAG